MTAEVSKLIERSKHALQVAQELLDRKHFSDAASKAYYSMFYVTQALLISRGIEVSKHSAVESSFGYHFARTGEIDPKYHQMLIGARKVRELADYAITDDIIGTVATQKVSDGKEFLEVIKSILLKE